jgi:competence protein ComEA
VPEGSRSTIVVWAVAAVLATFAAVRLLSPAQAPAPAPVRVSPGASGGHARPDGGIYVHVVGAVRRPGLMKLPAGSRVADALARAGGPGPHADLSAVNLAARLADGQQIVVPRRGAAATGPSAGPASAGASGGVAGLHLSTATVEQLEGIDGIGPTLAQRIIEYRDAHGGLGSLAELAQVDGIGEKRLATLREALQP